jgi:glycosyltransferase involved in cell wall biosynthesis
VLSAASLHAHFGAHLGAFSPWAGAALTLLLGILLVAGRRRYRALPVIPPIEPSSSARLPDCMVVIPARNEEAVVARAVRSLPPDTVIVVDDHSTDRTAEVAREAGAGVLTAPALPRNALGKPNACAFGAAALESRWVLFTDADTWFEPRFLDSVVACAEASNLSLLSIYLDPDYHGLAEHTLVPYARALAFAGFGVVDAPPGLFRDQCLLARREPYLFIGGHGAVLTQLSEDVKLTRLAERHRLALAVARASHLGHVRLYTGYAGIRAGIERQAFRFMALPSTVGVAILLAALSAALWLPVLAWLLWDRQWIAAAAFFAVPTFLLLPWYPHKRTALLAPLAIYWILPVLAAAFLSAVFGRPVEWKGRTVRAVS